MKEVISNINSKAVYSDDDLYRYSLTREWDCNKNKAAIIMLNPSTATETKFDTSVMNIHNFFIDYDNNAFGSYTVVNLFAFRSTDSRELNKRNDIQESYNDDYLERAFKESNIIVIGWGRSFKKVDKDTRKDIKLRIDEVTKILGRYSEKRHMFWDGEEELENIKSRHPVNLKKEWKLIKF